MMMVTIRFIRGTALGGIGNDAAPGDVRTLPEAEAIRLVSSGRAVVLAEPATPITIDAALDGAKPKRKKG